MTSPDTPRPDQLPFDASITRRTVLQASAIATAAGLVVKGGTGDLSGKVMVQVRTDKACDRPKPHTFTVPTA